MPSKNFDPKRDLILRRKTSATPEQIWKAWTNAAELQKWFAPRPWQTVEADIDAQPGGIFFSRMQGPNGESSPAEPGCVLEAIPNRRFAWTSELGPGFRPLLKSDTPAAFQITVLVTMEPVGEGSEYTVIVKHADEAAAKAHDEMGFQAGWGAAYDQMMEVIKSW